MLKETELKQLTVAELLSYIEKNGTMPSDSILDVIEIMEKEKAVLMIHEYSIAQGQGKDQRWFSRIRKDGKLKKVGKQTRQELIDYLYDFYFIKDSAVPSLAEVFDEWMELKLLTNRNNGVHRLETEYKRHYLSEPLTKELLHTPMDKITAIDLKRWSYQMIRKYDMTAKAYRNMFTIWRQVYDYLICDGKLTCASPCGMFKIPARDFRRVEKKDAASQTFTIRETGMVIDKACELAKETGDLVYYCIVIMFYSGMRPGEALALSFDDFDREHHSVLVHRSLSATEVRNPDGSWQTRTYQIEDRLKGNAEPRKVLLPDICFDYVDEIRKRSDHEDAFMFHVITPNNLEMKIYHICDSLGIPRRSPHKIRKTYLSTMVNSSVPIDLVRAQAGHTNTATTFNYYVYDNQEDEARVEMINKVFSKEKTS